MPRSPDSVQTYNRRYEAKRARCYVRGPRITIEAAEQLRELAHVHRMHPCDVVSLLLLATHPDKKLAARLAFQKRERLSDAEMAAFPDFDFTAPASSIRPAPTATGQGQSEDLK